jgi:TRAP-type C4-dicarboxylate transport system substrate-binding protein
MASIMIGGGIDAAYAEKPVVMKIATVWTSDDGSSVNKTINYLKPRIEQLTNGQVQVELKKGTLGGERDMFEGVQLGCGDLHGSLHLPELGSRLCCGQWPLW